MEANACPTVCFSPWSTIPWTRLCWKFFPLDCFWLCPWRMIVRIGHKSLSKTSLFLLSFINISSRLQDISLTIGDFHQTSCFWVYGPFRRKQLLFLCREQGVCYTPCGNFTLLDANRWRVTASHSYMPWKPPTALLCAFPHDLLSHGLDNVESFSLWTVFGSIHEELNLKPALCIKL